MPSSLQIADAVSALINGELDGGVLEGTTLIRESPFAEVAVAPSLERVYSGPLRCFVEPDTASVNETEGQDACSDEWAKQILIVLVQRLDDAEKPNHLPGDIEQVRELVSLGETLADKMLKATRLVTEGGTVSLDKQSAAHELFNRDWLRQRVFYSQIELTYG